MKKILFINACIREESRTLILAKHLLQGLEGEITEVNLNEVDIKPLDRETLNKRIELSKKKDFSDPMFYYAKQFREADMIVMAVPYWDMSFPAKFRIYIENINVGGITFTYSENGPVGLCKAKELIYITTVGGSFISQFGYEYIKNMANIMYGIKNVRYFAAEGLDIWGNDVNAILDKTKKEIDEYLNR
jgi:FMN-dependent NADH-azoreductase